MKINQWTLGLAAVGVVSLASAVKADEAKMNSIQTALSSTTISGYVDTSINWNSIADGKNFTVPAPGGTIPNPAAIPFSDHKADGFNLNVVKLSLEKAMDESEWAAGYKLDLLFGPNAVNYNPSIFGTSTTRNYSGSDFGIKQAYVALRTPVGNGIDWKVGVFDSIIGYETFDSGNNPNFTRSYGYSITPTEHTGVLATYRVCDCFALAAGVANTLSAGINDRNNELGNGTQRDAWRKTVMGSAAFTVPEDSGWLSGSTVYGGVVSGVNNPSTVDVVATPIARSEETDWYIGATFNTPVNNLKVGAAYNYNYNYLSLKGNEFWTLAGYTSYQATEKMSLHGRFEFGKADNNTAAALGDPNGTFLPTTPAGQAVDVYALTGTVQYDLWANVISRLEIRWDKWDTQGTLPDNPKSTVGLYANLIYKF
jgi:hypothetical protein